MALQLDAKEERLTGKQAAFLAAYVGSANFNASEAARQAGYRRGAEIRGHELVRNSKIRAAVQRVWRERGMEPEEIIGRLSDVARGSLDDFVDLDEFGSPYINLKKARDRGLLHTFESLEYSDKGRLKVRRYSALDALDKLARIRKMFADAQITVDVKILNVILDALPAEYREQVCAALEAEFTPEGDAASR